MIREATLVIQGISFATATAAALAWVYWRAMRGDLVRFGPFRQRDVAYVAIAFGAIALWATGTLIYQQSTTEAPGPRVVGRR